MHAEGRSAAFCLYCLLRQEDCMKKTSIVINFFMNFILTISQFLFPLITFPYASRILGPEGTGAVAMGTNYVSYFTMIAMLGVPVYGIRACAAVRDDPKKLARTIQELLIINLVMGAVAYTAFFLSLALVPSLRESHTLYAICSAAILLNILGMNWVYQALEQYSYITGISILFKFLGLIAMFLTVRNAESTLAYAAVTVLSSFGAGLINFIHLRKLVRFTGKGPWNFRRHFRPILHFFAMSVATTVYTSLDVVMLGFMKNNTVVGYYNAAVKIKTILVSLVTSLGTVLLPRLSYYYENHEISLFWSLVTRTFSFVFLFAVPCCLFFSVFAKDVILILSGDQFLPSIIPMIILMPTILLIGLTNITGMQVLVPEKREVAVLISVTAGAITDFILNLILIPFLDASGAAIGTLCAEIVVLIVQFYALKKHIPSLMRKVEWPWLIKALLPSLAVLVVCALFVNLAPFLRLVVGALCFFGCCGLILLLTKEPIVTSVLSRILHRKESLS